MSRLLPTFDPTVWMEVSAVVFLLLFTGLAIWIYLPSRRPIYETRGRLPLNED